MKIEQRAAKERAVSGRKVERSSELYSDYESSLSGKDLFPAAQRTEVWTAPPRRRRSSPQPLSFFMHLFFPVSTARSSFRPSVRPTDRSFVRVEFFSESVASRAPLNPHTRPRLFPFSFSPKNKNSFLEWKKTRGPKPKNTLSLPKTSRTQQGLQPTIR